MAMQFYKSNQQDKGETNILKADHVGKKVIEDIIRIFEEN
jgi:hypothetical protein